MQYVFENKEQTYELPIFKLTPLGLQKPTPGTKALRLKPEEWRDELTGEYYYYEVCGQHNAAATRPLLGSEVAKKYNFERWPTRMLYFSDDDFEGYFPVSSRDNKKDLKAPPRQLKLSMKDIWWQWKHNGCPRAVMGNPSVKQDQVRAWRRLPVVGEIGEAQRAGHGAAGEVRPHAGPVVELLPIQTREEAGRGLDPKGSVYEDMERNPTQFVGLLDFLGKKGEGVVFLGKPHARSVWDLLKASRHVVAMEGNAELLQFTMQVVKKRALLALGSRSGGNLKSAGIRTTSAEEPLERSGMQSRSGSGEPSKDSEIGSIAARDENVGKVSPEEERQPQGLQREAAGTGSGNTETTKSAEIRTSSGGGCRPGIVVPLRGAACTETEGRSLGFSTGTAEGDEFRGREVGEKMEERSQAL
ncbi:hypothetical protein CBR_g40485 [Chara braunii]|uniref:Uncharacterized protein n=1 Tax=Chara braunii TaxID=69332 RepID=A0A388LTV9_CHABU|nr:hypothetical protein CBR_g40485 [Chara braunii]|eukprot:GBG85756.1 hypothetical protein CBR_g40485 [Chara braunii]